MGHPLLQLLALANSRLGVVTLSGETVTSGSGDVGIRVNAGSSSSGVAGTIDSRKGTGPTFAQIDAATAWIKPNLAQGRRVFHIKLTIIESNMDAGSDTMNAWITLDQDRAWWHNTAGLTRNGTLEISDDGGTTVLDSGPYTFVRT